MTRAPNTKGFTLLEVMVAMAILAISLVALSEINAGAIAMHAYAKKLNVATMLARAKMLEIETQLDEKGLPAEGDNISPSDGNFEDEGFPQYKWKVEVVAPKSENLDAQKLIDLVMGGGSSPDGSSAGSGSGSMPNAALGGMGLASLLGGALPSASSSSDSSGAPTPTSSGLGGLGGLAAGAMGPAAQMMITQITQMVREVRLTVTWMDGKVPQDFTVVEHYVSMGQTLPAAPAGQTTKANANNPNDE